MFLPPPQPSLSSATASLSSHHHHAIITIIVIIILLFLAIVSHVLAIVISIHFQHHHDNHHQQAYPHTRNHPANSTFLLASEVSRCGCMRRVTLSRWFALLTCFLTCFFKVFQTVPVCVGRMRSSNINGFQEFFNGFRHCWVLYR